MKNPILLLSLLLIPFLGCSQSNCNSLPKRFNSYSDAVYQLKNAHFSYVDNVNTSRSSFVTSANYYSCDGKTGFLIIGLKYKEYIHKDVPIKVWQQFKQASSFGQFYNRNIKGRYILYLR